MPEAKTPSSFQYITAAGESYSVKYSITVYFNESDNALMSQSKEIQIVSRAKSQRRTDSQQTPKKFQSYDPRKDKDDLTIQNMEEMATPNKVGFDSLESVIADS